MRSSNKFSLDYTLNYSIQQRGGLEQLMGSLRVTNLILVAILFTFSGRGMHAQSHACSAADSEQADKEASKLQTWDSLHHSYNRFVPRCDDGSIAEGYSESVRRLFIDHWEKVGRFANLSADDQGFEKFVLRHVDATIDIRDLKQIKRNATHNCPIGQTNLCRQIILAADRALREP